MRRESTQLSEVIRRCAQRDETWINRELIESYTRLHEAGHAHSVEMWQEGKLVGGLYGVTLGGAFFGESMFHDVTDASKVALVSLLERLRARRFILLDTQWLTPHLQRFGAIGISRRQYMHLLTGRRARAGIQIKGCALRSASSKLALRIHSCIVTARLRMRSCVLVDTWLDSSVGRAED